MDERVEKWLYDILNAIEEVEGFFTERSYNFREYQQNTLLKRGIERNLEIIGEAVNRIRNRDSYIANQISEFQSIIALRNQVIHAYDNISDENIWAILIHHLPVLKREINDLLADY